MCYSAMIVQDVKAVGRKFAAQINEEAFLKLFKDRLKDPKSIKIPQGLADFFVREAENKAEFALLQRDFFDLDKAAAEKQMQLIESYNSNDPQKVKLANESALRIYPNYYGYVIVKNKDQREIVPMRYRVRPHGSEKEIPSKYNVFNARADSLWRPTWKPLFGRKHAIFIYSKFFEWVTGSEGKAKQIGFSNENQSWLWSPALFDTWISQDQSKIINSFAIITTDPPPEIQEMGHDRCPIYLNSNQIDNWLNPQNLTLDELHVILQQQEPVRYSHTF